MSEGGKEQQNKQKQQKTHSELVMKDVLLVV